MPAEIIGWSLFRGRLEEPVKVCASRDHWLESFPQQTWGTGKSLCPQRSLAWVFSAAQLQGDNTCAGTNQVLRLTWLRRSVVRYPPCANKMERDAINVQNSWRVHNLVVFVPSSATSISTILVKKSKTLLGMHILDGWAFPKCTNHCCRVNSLAANVTQWTPSWAWHGRIVYFWKPIPVKLFRISKNESNIYVQSF